jgi:hypothetical protein
MAEYQRKRKPKQKGKQKGNFKFQGYRFLSLESRWGIDKEELTRRAMCLMEPVEDIEVF